jgi:hypothetical protein
LGIKNASGKTRGAPADNIRGITAIYSTRAGKRAADFTVFCIKRRYIPSASLSFGCIEAVLMIS